MANKQSRNKPGPGRPKGSPNKVTRDMREIVREAFEKAGGVDYLVTQADANPKAFMGILAKLLPNTVEVDPTDGVRVADRMREARERMRAERGGG